MKRKDKIDVKWNQDKHGQYDVTFYVDAEIDGKLHKDIPITIPQESLKRIVRAFESPTSW